MADNWHVDSRGYRRYIGHLETHGRNLAGLLPDVRAREMRFAEETGESEYFYTSRPSITLRAPRGPAGARDIRGGAFYRISKYPKVGEEDNAYRA